MPRISKGLKKREALKVSIYVIMKSTCPLQVYCDFFCSKAFQIIWALKPSKSLPSQPELISRVRYLYLNSWPSGFCLIYSMSWSCLRIFMRYVVVGATFFATWYSPFETEIWPQQTFRVVAGFIHNKPWARMLWRGGLVRMWDATGFQHQTTGLPIFKCMV